MYSTIFELPSQVRNSLDETDQKKWMAFFNEHNAKTEEEVKKATRDAWFRCRNLPSSFSFRIKASVDAVDKDKEVITIDSVKKHIDAYIDAGGPIQADHSDYQVGVGWGWEPVTVDGKEGVELWGNIYGGDNGVFDNTRKAFVEGMNSLSIAGEADLGRMKCDDRGCAVHRSVRQILEVSVCRVPANPFCTLSWYNKDARLKKSQEEKGSEYFTLGVTEYEIHKTYNECPFLSLKKSLMDIGYEAHATPVGVFVPMSLSDYRKTLPRMKKAGISSVWSDGEALLNDREYLVEQTFKDGIAKGYIDPDGRVNEKVTKSQFTDMCDRDVLYRDDSEYYIG